LDEGADLQSRPFPSAAFDMNQACARLCTRTLPNQRSLRNQRNQQVVRPTPNWHPRRPLLCG